jgi:hypothetical protein
MDNLFQLTNEEGVDFFCKSYKYAWDNDIQSTMCASHRCYSNGKLSFIKDPEAKLRIIAISDYYTQLYLKPIHLIILQILKERFKETDRTFTQDPFHKWEDNGHKF